ncbi:MAG: 2-oxoacid:acceptor oxidoreductase subunit alpha [Methanomicrobiaceae archaeon]|nr:2-oxoacid:acceptor oxidoreductase subunit alpha [Methanomicrobiaceae archaeon]
MNDYSILIGGKAGEGINKAGSVIARILSHRGYFQYMYYDYPSLIRGGHNFAIVRSSTHRVGTHRNAIDFLLALDQNTVDTHRWRCGEETAVLFNASKVEAEGMGIPIDDIVEEEGGSSVMVNTCLIGAFGRAAGIPWNTMEEVLTLEIPKKIETNLRIARRGYDAVEERTPIPPQEGPAHPILSGNEAIGLGLLDAGLDAYVAYPMTPSSGILHFLAEAAEDFAIKVIHPENEIAVMLMALGCAYAGARTAVGTSGGGFCLMSEGLSMAGMTEEPIAIVMGQRGGPSTGTPTYTAQGDLHFILNAGQGEFPRFVISPGNAEQAYEWSARALNLSWKYQAPSFILVDKTLAEGIYSFDRDIPAPVGREKEPRWEGESPYHRYADTETGVSPLAAVPLAGEVIKVNSYHHDEHGTTTEDAELVAWLNEKRMRKEESMLEAIEGLSPVAIAGDGSAETALLCWGSNIGVCTEIAEEAGLRVIQPLVLSPFPVQAFNEALENVTTLVAVETNLTGQLTRLVEGFGCCVDDAILRYDGRPFSLEDLREEVEEVIE